MTLHRPCELDVSPSVTGYVAKLARPLWDWSSRNDWSRGNGAADQVCLHSAAVVAQPSSFAECL